MRPKQELADALADIIGADVSAADIEEPDQPGHGDYALPMMGLADDPRAAAESAADEIAGHELVERAEVAGPGYLNMFVDRELFAQRIMEMLQEEHMGVAQRDGSLLLEFSQPNMAKPMHVGHFRNNALGDALQRIFRFVGYDVTSENYIGDWGTQYGKLIHAFKEYGSMEEFEEQPMEHMFDLYVKFHEELEDDPEMEEKGREWARRIEEGDDEAVELWEMFREASMAHHQEDYERMDVEFDRVTGESTVVEGTKEILADGVERGIIEEDDDGSLYIEFEELPDVVVRRADGATLYLSRDLENLRKRKEDEGFDYNLILTGSEQELHFQQVFAACEKLGIDTSGCEHISYGLLNLPEGSMSSREGRIIRLSDLLDEAVEQAEQKLAEEGKHLNVAEEIGIGAAKYANLRVSRNKNIEFDWDRVLSFEGDAGPYLQYANTRAKSILAKVDGTGRITGEPTDREHALVTALAGFPGAVEAAADQREPAKLATYLADLSDTFNTFYHECRVLDADSDAARQRRLALVRLFRDVTDQGLELLGIDPLEAM
ncbi:MAG: arginine--tRNA ligase [Candidatus Nanohaloarchaea archaeon]|nr:arginine--tRNA ligase [Candidatus Nanohaloarchaea archaeon]